MPSKKFIRSLQPHHPDNLGIERRDNVIAAATRHDEQHDRRNDGHRIATGVRSGDRTASSRCL
jgi:hypothetical protein